jgi:type VI protein secretion system component VasK
VYTARAYNEHLAAALAGLPELLRKLLLADEDKQRLSDYVVGAVEAYSDDYAAQYRALVTSLRCRARSTVELRLILAQMQASGSPLRLALREVTRNTGLTLPKENPFTAPLEAMSDEFAALRALAPATGPATQLGGFITVLRSLQAALDGRGPLPGDKEPEDGLRARLSPLGRLALSIYRADEDSPKIQVERWLTAANLDSEWWPAFSAPVEEAYALGRRELQKTTADIWNELVQGQLQPLGESFPFKRDAEAPASSAMVEAALAPKQTFWSAFEAGVAPLLTGARDGWRSREGRTSPLLPAELLPTVNRLSAVAALLFDKDGKPRPIVMRVRPLPLAPLKSEPAGAPSVLSSYLQAGGSTVYGFNQRPDWTTLKLEWWKTDSAAVGVSVNGSDGRSYRAVSVSETPWSFWRLLARASGDGSHIYTWQVGGPDGRTVPVQFEIKDEPWTRFALR